MKLICYLKALIVTLSISACDLILEKELDKIEAEKIINGRLNNSDLSQEDLNNCNAELIIVEGGEYLFITNSFNGDFNGYVYSTEKTIKDKNLRFKDFTITYYDEADENWTKVYGKR